MNKRILGALGLSIILSIQCIYAEDIQVNPNLSTQPQVEEEQIISNTVIEEKEQTIDSKIIEEEQENDKQIIVEEEQAIIENTIVESGQTTDDIVAIKEENIENKVILKLNDTLAIVGGVKENLFAPPTVINGTTLLPMRFVAEKVVGGKVDWDSKTKTVTMEKGDTVIKVTIGTCFLSHYSP